MDNKQAEIVGIFLPTTDNKITLKFLYRNKLETALFALLLASIIAFCIIILIPSIKTWSVIPLLLSAIFFILHFLAQVLSDFRSFLNPKKTFINELLEIIPTEQSIVFKLLQYKRSELVNAKLRLSFQAEIIKSRLSYMLGAIDKLGIFPAAFAMYIGYAKAKNDDILPNEGSIYLLCFFIGLYVGAIIAKQLYDNLSKMIMLIDQAIRQLDIRDEKN